MARYKTKADLEAEVARLNNELFRSQNRCAQLGSEVAELDRQKEKFETLAEQKVFDKINDLENQVCELSAKLFDAELYESDVNELLARLNMTHHEWSFERGKLFVHPEVKLGVSKLFYHIKE